jgi:hypothetical protein
MGTQVATLGATAAVVDSQKDDEAPDHGWSAEHLPTDSGLGGTGGFDGGGGVGDGGGGSSG